MPGENGKGTFWKVVQVTAVALLGWISVQLMVVPQHTFLLKAHEETLSSHTKQLDAIKDAKAEEQRERQEMLTLLRSLAARKSR